MTSIHLSQLTDFYFVLNSVSQSVKRRPLLSIDIKLFCLRGNSAESSDLYSLLSCVYKVATIGFCNKNITNK